MRQVGLYLGLAFAVPAAAFVGYLIGYEIDLHAHTSPVFTIVFLALGFAAGLIEVLRTVSRAS
ncbi:MAG: AtpZ/AtpI family protein [Terriglobales bacterium]